MTRNYVALSCHVLGFFGSYMFHVIPFANIIAPLVLWLAKRDDELVNQHGKEAVNFQISMTLYFMAVVMVTVGGFILMGGSLVDIDSDNLWAVLLGPGMLVSFGGVLILFALTFLEIFFVILACFKAVGGKEYKYPLSIRLIK